MRALPVGLAALLLLLAACTRPAMAIGGMSILQNVGKVCSVADDTKNCGAGFTCGPCLQRPNVEKSDDPNKECEIGRDGECQPCSQGDFCPDGSKNPLAWTGMHMCPAGKFCENSTVQWDCAPGFFCPPGVFTYDSNLTGFELDCPEGKGLYCGNGSSTFLTPCPKGFYCPVPGEKYECKKNHFCKDFSLFPAPCQFGTICPSGSKAPGMSFLGVASTVAAVVIMQGIYKMIMWQIHVVEVKNSLDSAESKKISETTRTVMSKLLSIPSYALPELVSGFKPKTVPVTIEFVTLGLRVGEKIVIRSISGKFQESRLTAVMGPSGCGKSSLLNTVSNRANYGTTTGTILINGQQRSISKLERVMAFVPQDDTVFGELTVRENLRYSAQLRLSRDAQDMANLLTGGVLQVLGLTHIQNSVVGSVEKRGISGGQKKRVNIGMELVADPTLVFLDEPTSGLGATDTLIVMKGLKSMAFLRRTVVAVIHQPRYEVFTLFHQVLLLGVGGNTVFMGDSRQALPYFQRIGFELPPNENPADYFMDVIAGHAIRQGDPKFKPNDLFALWDEHGHTVEEEEMVPSSSVELPEVFVKKIKAQWDKMDEDGGGSIQASELQPLLEELGTPITDEEADLVLTVLDEDGSGEIEFEEFLGKATTEYSMMKSNVRSDEEVVSNVSNVGQPNGASPNGKGGKEFKKGRRPSFFQRHRTFNRMRETPVEEVGHRDLPKLIEQYQRFCHRGSTQWIRSYDTVVIYDVVLLLGASLAVGFILGADWDYPDVPRNALLSTVTIGVLTVVSSLKTFGQEKVMIARESKTGVNLLAYFLGKCSVALIDNVWQPSLFLSVYFSMTMPHQLFFHYWYILIVNTYACHGIGIFMSVMMHPTNALLAGVIFPLVTGVFLGGVDPRLSQMSPGMKTVAGLSFARWTTEAITIAELESEPSYQQERVEVMYERLGYHPNNYWVNIAALFVMGFMFRVFAYISLAGGFQKFLKDVLVEMGNMIDGGGKKPKKAPHLRSIASRGQRERASSASSGKGMPAVGGKGFGESGSEPLLGPGANGSDGSSGDAPALPAPEPEAGAAAAPAPVPAPAAAALDKAPAGGGGHTGWTPPPEKELRRPPSRKNSSSGSREERAPSGSGTGGGGGGAPRAPPSLPRSPEPTAARQLGRSASSKHRDADAHPPGASSTSRRSASMHEPGAAAGDRDRRDRDRDRGEDSSGRRHTFHEDGRRDSRELQRSGSKSRRDADSDRDRRNDRDRGSLERSSSRRERDGRDDRDRGSLERSSSRRERDGRDAAAASSSSRREPRGDRDAASAPRGSRLGSSERERRGDDRDRDSRGHRDSSSRRDDRDRDRDRDRDSSARRDDRDRDQDSSARRDDRDRENRDRDSKGRGGAGRGGSDRDRRDRSRSRDRAGTGLSSERQRRERPERGGPTVAKIDEDASPATKYKTHRKMMEMRKQMANGGGGGGGGRGAGRSGEDEGRSKGGAAARVKGSSEWRVHDSPAYLRSNEPSPHSSPPRSPG